MHPDQRYGQYYQPLPVSDHPVYPVLAEVSLAVLIISAIKSSASTTVPSRLFILPSGVPPYRKRSAPTLYPIRSPVIKQNGKYLEMVILFVAYHINHLVNGIICKAEFGSTYILRHVDRSTVRTETATCGPTPHQSGLPIQNHLLSGRRSLSPGPPLPSPYLRGTY